MGSFEPEACEEELERWKHATFVLAGLLGCVLLLGAFALARRMLSSAHQRLKHRGWYSTLEEDGLGAAQQQQGQQDGGELSDSLSESSSLFSPPFRANNGVDYPNAAASIADTQAYLPPSVSTERLERLLDSPQPSTSPSR